MNDRISKFMIKADGGRSFGLTVRGIKVLVTADAENLADGELLAQQIAELGPEGITPVEMPRPAPRSPKPAPRPAFAVGQRIYCRVHGAEGYRTVTAIGDGHHRGYIKITGERAWCPSHNFEIREES